jgi:hypothetical protein
VVASEFVERHAAQPLDQVAQDDVADVAVDELSAGLGLRLELIDALERLLPAVAIGLVREARSKTTVGPIKVVSGSRLRLPYALRKTMWPR